MEIKEGEESIRLSRAAVSASVQQFTPTPAVAPAATVTASAADAPMGIETALPDGHVVKSPMVGTYYSAANPDSTPFVEVGTVVSVGEPLCVVEAMKIFNQIESDYAGNGARGCSKRTVTQLNMVKPYLLLSNSRVFPRT